MKLFYQWLEPWDSKVVPDIRELLSQLTTKRERVKTFSGETLKALFRNQQTYVVVARDTRAQKIVGIAVLIIYQELLYKKGLIDSMVVHRDYRGKGIARGIMGMLIEKARSLGLDALELTSNKDRVAANALYESLGFKIPNTNFRRLSL